MHTVHAHACNTQTQSMGDGVKSTVPYLWPCSCHHAGDHDCPGLEKTSCCLSHCRSLYGCNTKDTVSKQALFFWHSAAAPLTIISTDAAWAD